MNENALNLARAAQLIPPLHGKRQCAHPKTLTRWIRRGRIGADGARVCLEAILLSGCYVTSREALSRFLDAIAIPAQADNVAKPKTARISAAVSAALEEAERLGV